MTPRGTPGALSRCASSVLLSRVLRGACRGPGEAQRQRSRKRREAQQEKRAFCSKGRHPALDISPGFFSSLDPLPSLALLSLFSLALSPLPLALLSRSLTSLPRSSHPPNKTMQTPPSGSTSSSRRCGTHEGSPCPTHTCWDSSGGRAGERALDFLFFKPFFALLSPLLSSSRPRPFLFPSIFQTMDRPTNQPTNQPTNPPTKTEKPKNQKPKTKSLLFHRIKPGV